MSRDALLARYVSKEALGLEIGPCHAPVARKADGYRVHVMDHLNRAQLVEKYRNQDVNLDNIEEVDFVWNGQGYAELTGAGHQYDWIIASHMIEHTPDLVGFLNDCESILKPEGVICLAVPDKRYCFDYFRPLTSLSQVVDAHVQKRTLHSPGTVAEFFLNFTHKGERFAWDRNHTGEYRFIHGLDDATKWMRAVIEEQIYIDMHAWCFVPHSFRLLIEDLVSLQLIQVREVEFFPTVAYEFFMVLGRHGQGARRSRMELLGVIDAELNRTI